MDLNSTNLPYKISLSAWEGINLFNSEKYFEAHELLEIAWRDEHDNLRGLYQGILQAGICILHLRKGNLAGALKIADRAICHLSPWQKYRHPLDIARLYKDLIRVRKYISLISPVDQIAIQSIPILKIIYDLNN